MAGNTLGELFRVSNFGESHGPAIGCIIDGCPPGLALTAEDIQVQLDRRRPGTSRYVTQRQEADAVEILSGIYEGTTTGAPIALLIRNTDQRSQDYANIVQSFRPGHADFSYWYKYGIRDPRGGGRSSARLTASAVAAGAIARKWLSEQYDIRFRACMTAIGEVDIDIEDWAQVEHNPFFAANNTQIEELGQYLDVISKEGDSVGACVRVEAQNVPLGLGEPIYDRLDADIAKAMMAINAVKGVEIGDGFSCISQRGSEHGDEITPRGFLSNHAGGILGGISTGQDVIVHLAIKPTSSIHIARQSIDVNNQPVSVQTRGRHDPCVGIRAVPVAEAMLALVLMDHTLRHLAQCGQFAPQGFPFTMQEDDSAIF